MNARIDDQPEPEPITKDTMEFFLRRCIRDADERADAFTQEGMARRGVPYGEREAEFARGEPVRQEARALRAVLDIVRSRP